MAALSQTPGSVISTGTKKVGTSGATITAGMPVWRDAAAANVLKSCRANAIGTASCDGIALNGASTGQPVSYVESGPVNLGATLVVGETYCVSDAVLGQIVPISDLAAGDYVTILGVATTASNLALDIQNSATVKP